MEHSYTSLQLPHGWTQARLEQFADIIQGQSPPSSTYNEVGQGLPFYQGKLEFSKIYPTTRKWCTRPTKIAEKGDVLISVRAPVGPTNVCPEKSCIGRGLAAIRGLGGVETFLILYLIRNFEEVLSGQGTGTTFNAISGSHLRNLELPLPPLPEQHRIVAKIEELFSRLEAGVEALNKIRLQLKRYRQAVLKTAFEGKLTADWRKAHKGELEPASVLLEKIKAERAKNGKYKELPPLDTSDLPRLPEGWVWVRLQDFGDKDKYAIVDGPFGSNLKVSDYVKDGRIPVISITNIDEGFNKNNLRYITEKKYETLKRSAVHPGDIIVAKIGSSYGKAGYYPDWMPTGIIPANLLKMTVSGVLCKEFVFYYLKSPEFKKRLDTIMKSTAQPAFNVSAFRLLPIPFPPFREHHRIVEEIERHLSVADQIEKVTENSLKQSNRLRQSILKKAFEGKLVPQDPDDEPAEKLLERIKAEKARQQAGAVTARAGNKKSLAQGRLV